MPLRLDDSICIAEVVVVEEYAILRNDALIRTHIELTARHTNWERDRGKSACSGK